MSFSRRDFSKMAGLAVAGTLTPGVLRADAPGGKRIGYCAVGLGRISVGHFMPGLLQSQHGKLTGLVSGSPDKAKKLAAQYGVPTSSIYSYEQYDRMRDNPAIDAVYIGLPNSMHAEYTIRAAKAGKHVLCEKPMCTSVADAKAMIAACDAAGRKLMIAYRCRLDPVYLKIVAMIRGGVIGQVEAIESGNGFNIRAGEWRLNRKLAGGGPLMDVGIYSLNSARFLTGEEPEVISAYSSVIDKDGRFAEVEENLGWTMKFPSGIVTSCNTSYGATMEGYFRVHGSKGELQLRPAFSYDGIHLVAEVNKAGGGNETIDMPTPIKDPQQFTIEGDYFADCILQDRVVKVGGEEGLRDMELMSQIYRAAGAPTL